MKSFSQKVGSFKLPAFRTGGSVSGDRTTALFRELQRYAAHYKSIEKETQRWQTVVTGTFTSISNVMRFQLPKTYEETPEGQPIPSESDVGIIGEGVNVDGLTHAADQHVVRLESDVARSTQAWLLEFRDVQNRMKQLENQRNELDARNRKAESLKSKIDQLKMRLSTAKPGVPTQKDELLLTETQHQLEMVEQSVQTMQGEYRNSEHDTYEAMEALRQKCPQLQVLTAKLVKNCQDTFQAAYDAFVVSYGVDASLQSGGTLDRSGQVAYHLGDTNYGGYPQSPPAGHWAGGADAHPPTGSYGENDSYNQPAPHYGWGAPKADEYSIESARHAADRYPKVQLA